MTGWSGWRAERWLTKVLGKLANCRWRPLARLLIRLHIYFFKVSLDEAVIPQAGFDSFNAFFTRALAPDARAVSQEDRAIVAPCDGSISQAGQVEDGQLLQAKGLIYSLEELLADTQMVRAFVDGCFVTAYLSPRDYHRVHAPVSCRLLETRYIKGRLFSVRPSVQAQVPALFARNERLIMVCEAAFGKMLLIMVGARLVSGIQTCWQPGGYGHHQTPLSVENFSDRSLMPAIGEEVGRFAFGSTVILLLPKTVALSMEAVRPGTPLRYGQAIGRY